jgi:alkylation response protein AidB-like acyl-CoA dehydrogenase
MDFEYRPEDEAFRHEVRAFIAAELPPELAAKVARGYYPTNAEQLFWMNRLHSRGWAAPHWPKEYGGAEWPHLWHLIFDEEQRRANAPIRVFPNIYLAGPLIFNYGTQEQKKRFLEPMLDGTHFWCQGFSEPNAGSDLASLQMRAVREGDHYVLNGQKIWNSNAYRAHWSFTLVRTDPVAKKQAGLSLMFVDMKSPGLTVRPMKMINGEYFLAETFYDNVRVPVENLLGEENMGWTYAKGLLAKERSHSAEVPSSKHDLVRLKWLASQDFGNGLPLIANSDFRRKIAEVEVDLLALETSVLRVISSADKDSLAVASVLKIRGSEMRQRLSELMMTALGEYGLIYYPNPDEQENPNEPYPPGPSHAHGVTGTFLHRRATTIYGGANEIQRNIIAKNTLGL